MTLLAKTTTEKYGDNIRWKIKEECEMKVALFGATGYVAPALPKEACDRGHTGANPIEHEINPHYGLGFPILHSS
jgi:hypothetical protein